MPRNWMKGEVVEHVRSHMREKLCQVDVRTESEEEPEAQVFRARLFWSCMVRLEEMRVHFGLLVNLHLLKPASVKLVDETNRGNSDLPS